MKHSCVVDDEGLAWLQLEGDLHLWVVNQLAKPPVGPVIGIHLVEGNAGKGGGGAVVEPHAGQLAAADAEGVLTGVRAILYVPIFVGTFVLALPPGDQAALFVALLAAAVASGRKS